MRTRVPSFPSSYLFTHSLDAVELDTTVSIQTDFFFLFDFTAVIFPLSVLLAREPVGGVASRGGRCVAFLKNLLQSVESVRHAGGLYIGLGRDISAALND